MRIRELFENTNAVFDENKFVEKNQKGKYEPNFDLVEDLIYYMNEDDEMYRRHLYPVLAKALQSLSGKKNIDCSIFSRAVEECYKSYTKKFPIRYIPDELDNGLREQACTKLFDNLKKDFEEGKYKN